MRYGPRLRTIIGAAELMQQRGTQGQVAEEQIGEVRTVNSLGLRSSNYP